LIHIYCYCYHHCQYCPQVTHHTYHIQLHYHINIMTTTNQRIIAFLTIVKSLQSCSSYTTGFTNTKRSTTNLFKMNAAEDNTRRTFLSKTTAAAACVGVFGSSLVQPKPVNAIGPVKVNIINPVYTAVPCPPSKPIPGEKAMKGLRGLCVTVQADLENSPEKDLEKVGVYGFITDADSGDSVLANNPDLSSDAGQFTMIESVTTKTKRVEFEFVAAVPKEKDLKQYENGIGPLKFGSLRIVSYPGGQQYGAISPCEMNEFSSECDDWEKENGPYTKSDYMIKSNKRTKGY